MQLPNFLRTYFFLSPLCPLCKLSLKWDGQLFYCPKNVRIDNKSVWFKFNYFLYKKYTKIDGREAFNNNISHFLMSKDRINIIRLFYNNYVLILDMNKNKFLLYYFETYNKFPFIAEFKPFKIISEEQLKYKIDTYTMLA